MKRSLKILCCGAMLAAAPGMSQTMIQIPLSLSGTNPFTWNNASWWTNTVVPTNIETWQAWWAANTNFATLQGEFTTAIGSTIPGMISSALGSSGFLTTNQIIALSGDATGSGRTAIIVTTTNIQPPGGGSTGQPLIKTASGVGFGAISAASVTGLTDADTNSVIQSGTFVAASTNWFYTSAGTTNVLPWTLTNFAGVNYTVASGVPSMLWSTDSGATWQVGAETLVTNVAVKLAVFGGAGFGNATNIVVLNGDVGLTNIVALGLSRADQFGHTNQLIGQTLRVGTPVNPNDAVPKSYADALAGQVGQLNASQEGQLNGFGLHLDSAWNLYSASSNNALTAVFLGGTSWSVAYPVPSGVTNAIRGTVSSRTNMVVYVPTNGIAITPVLKISHYLKPLNWLYVNTTATNSGTNWVYSFASPWADSAWVVAVVPSPNPGVFNMATVLQMPMMTITNSTDTTWGYGAGLVVHDASYLYESVGSNSWKRAAFSSW